MNDYIHKHILENQVSYIKSYFFQQLLRRGFIHLLFGLLQALMHIFSIDMIEPRFRLLIEFIAFAMQGLIYLAFRVIYMNILCMDSFLFF